MNSQPAVSTQASASIAAGGAGIRHIAHMVCFSGGSTTAPALTNLQVNLRDGATIDQFLEWFPGVTRAQVEAVLNYEVQTLSTAVAA